MYFKRLKEKWGITSNLQLIIIFIVFGITGSLSIKLGRPFLNYINLNPVAFESFYFGRIMYWVLRLLVIFPIYQILLLVFGALFFQFNFFWSFEKKILKKIGLKCLFKDS